MNEELKCKLDLYDKIITSCMVNTYSAAKDTNKIILRNFDETNPYHLFEYEVAKIVKTVKGLEIYVDMKLIKYIKFKFKQKKVKIRKYKKSQNYNDFNIMEMLKYVTDAYEVELDFIKEIYNSYWAGKEAE